MRHQTVGLMHQSKHFTKMYEGIIYIQLTDHAQYIRRQGLAKDTR